MKLEWNNKDANIGFYELELELEDGTKREIVVWDNTCEYQKRENEKDPAHARYNPRGFRVNYCHGYSMEEFFDDTHTLEEVKIWAENFLLDNLIEGYKDMLANLETARRQAEWSAAYKEARDKR